MKNMMKKSAILFFTLILTLLIIPMKPASAEDNTQELVWGNVYSGELYGMREYYEYTFTLPKSGRINLLFTVTSNGSMGTGLDDIQIYDAYDTQMCGRSVDSGTTTVSAELLAGEYKLKIYAGLWTGCYFSFTPSFTASGETKSESYNKKNDEISLAPTCKIETKCIGQFAEKDNIDTYKIKVKKKSPLTVSINSKIGEYDVSICNENGRSVKYTQNIKAGSYKFTTLLTKGTYYLMFKSEMLYTNSVITNYTGNYTFKAYYSKVPSTKFLYAKNISSKTLDLVWKQKSDIYGYEVQLAKNRKFTKGKKRYYFSSDTDYTYIDNLKKRSYYVRIRTYKKTPDEICFFSSWSKPKKVKIKK